MEMENLRSAAEKITLSEDKKRRILHNCETHIVNIGEEYTMYNRKTTSVFKKSAAVFAALAVCLSLSVTALASTDALRGYFHDITNFFGAVFGTSYEQATDEIHMVATVNGEELIVRATFLKPGEFPYREAELLGVAEYRIIDAAGKVLQKGIADPTPVVNGQSAIVIGLKDMETGSYTLSIGAFVAEKKADRPLTIHGSWECTFTR